LLLDSIFLLDFFAEVSATGIATNMSTVNNIHNLYRSNLVSLFHKKTNESIKIQWLPYTLKGI